MICATSANLIQVCGALGTITDGVIPASSGRGLLVQSVEGLFKQFENTPQRFVNGELGPTKAARSGNSYPFTLAFPLDVGDSASLNIGHFLMLVLGKTSIAGTTPNFTHTFTTIGATLSQKALENLRLIIGASHPDFLNKYGGCKVSTLTLKIDAEANSVEVTVELWGMTEASFTFPTSLNFSGANILAGCDVTTLIGGSEVYCKELTMVFDRKLEYIRTQSGSPDPKCLISKGLDVKVSGTLFFNSTSDAVLDGFRTNPTASTAFTVELADAADATNRKLTIALPNIMLGTVKGPNYSADNTIMLPFEGFSTGNATAALKNARSTAYDVADV